MQHSLFHKVAVGRQDDATSHIHLVNNSESKLDMFRAMPRCYARPNLRFLCTLLLALNTNVNVLLHFAAHFHFSQILDY